MLRRLHEDVAREPRAPVCECSSDCLQPEVVVGRHAADAARPPGRDRFRRLARIATESRQILPARVTGLEPRGKILEHRALSGSSHSSRALQLNLASPNSRLAEILGTHSSVMLSKNSEDHAEFDFSGTSDEQAQLLAALIQAGLAISSFGEQNLQQAYLRTIKEKK